ncbi:SDR family oxidoreductase [Paraconexibacter antarcticus]|uniref:SDR family oxidoreductase n=1 Tax=Paraconexibacter antarcticus TaxID=2949664 RepID=A0ABY5DWJ2_9ACTN|nr:SDR family oxidoreductase [Paraconexibacter antarcticus]UTI64914.1 SDR family oxidoreductase [Paraconexibacter antarcticus]
MQIQTGTRAFITGASRGIGRALAVDLAGRGATLGLAARSTDELEALAATLPGEHHVLRCDVADEASVREAIAAFAAAAGGLDLLVANAGLTHYGPFRDQTMDQLRQMTDVNWYGTLFTVHAGLPLLLAQAPARPGHIVIVSSGAGLRSFPSAAVYGATKAAQRMFGEALRHELGGTGVGLTVVYPGEIKSSLHDHEKARMPAWYHGDEKAAPAEALVEKIVAAVEADDRAVHFPPFVRLLGAVHGLSPKLADRLLHRLRGASAAPRLD